METNQELRIEALPSNAKELKNLEWSKILFQEKDLNIKFTSVEKNKVTGITVHNGNLQTFVDFSYKQLLAHIYNIESQEPIKHKAYASVLESIQRDYTPYLYGEAGTGKNIICEQVAKELGLTFYSQNSVQTKFDLIGYSDANGEYVPTPFYEAFTKGGLFFIDELDNSDPQAIKSLNQAIGSRYYSFPKIGMVKAHESFRCITAGNTCGRGAGDYVANVIDPSTLNRFRFIRVDYDENIEMRISMGNKELVDFFHAIRKASKEAGYYIVASYRGLKGVSEFEDTADTHELIEQFVTQGMDADEINTIYGRFDVEFAKSNTYAKALKKLAQTLQ